MALRVVVNTCEEIGTNRGNHVFHAVMGYGLRKNVIAGIVIARYPVRGAYRSARYSRYTAFGDTFLRKHLVLELPFSKGVTHFGVHCRSHQ